MVSIYFILSTVILLSAADILTNYEDEIDPVIDLLIFGDYDSVMELNGNLKDANVEENQPVYIDNIWKCGNCSHIGELKLIYNETYNFDYNVYDDAPNMEIQIGLSLHDMQCITVKAEEESEVHRVSGACAGDDVTISVANALNCVISVYS